MQLTRQQKAATFQALHDGPAFLMPNPWDVGSARVLERLGFKALGTTSSGFAFTLGRQDGGATLDEVIEHVRSLDRWTSLPISVDLENGYGPEPEDVAVAIARAAEAGAVGGSIEDYDPKNGRIYSIPHAIERVAAASATAKAFGHPFMVTARAENHICDNPDLQDTIGRLQAYEQAGADVLYAPGLNSRDQIRAVCEAISRPLNVLARPGLSLSDITDAGATRISIGGALTWVALEAMITAARNMADHGDFSRLNVRGDMQEWFDT